MDLLKDLKDFGEVIFSIYNENDIGFFVEQDRDYDKIFLKAKFEKGKDFIMETKYDNENHCFIFTYTNDYLSKFEICNRIRDMLGIEKGIEIPSDFKVREILL